MFASDVSDVGQLDDVRRKLADAEVKLKQVADVKVGVKAMLEGDVTFQGSGDVDLGILLKQHEGQLCSSCQLYLQCYIDYILSEGGRLVRGAHVWVGPSPQLVHSHVTMNAW